jgi:molecular chaperone HtpG
MSDTFNESVRRGGISVETQHIFPIIKKWLYSDKDIFLREIVSNASDAIIKLKRLHSLGQFSLPEGEEFKITVKIDKDESTITVTDNGIGMTLDELQKYICSIALSGALDFIEKYEGGDKSGGIIGHFGLGFYSSFMVSDTVEVDTLSYQGSEAVHFTCAENGEYEISASNRTERGTSVIMHISEAEKDYLESSKLRSILNKYCSFMPVEIYFEEGEAEHNHDDGCECDECKPHPVNDTEPLWCRPASEITNEQYNEFYHKIFADYEDPLFSIHINADYPLNFKGILYFPKIKNEAQSLEGEIKLYYNQVFVADNIKEVLPEYLLMLRGALDCPELPLNVSRSYLQDNAYVKKIGQHIVKKVADKLNSLLNNDRDAYEKIYEDIRVFIEYACLREKKFYDRVKDSLMLRLVGDDGKSEKTVTIDEYLETAKGKHEGKIYYTNDVAQQSQAISLLRNEGIEVAIFDLVVDSQYLAALEHYRSDLNFTRVDSGVSEVLKEAFSESNAGSEVLADLFKKVSGNEKLTVVFESLKNEEIPAILSVSEESRRMEDMMKLYALGGGTEDAFPLDYSLTVNIASPLYTKLTDMIDSSDDKLDVLTSYIYKLALLAQKKPSASELTAFLSDSYKILGMI